MLRYIAISLLFFCAACTKPTIENCSDDSGLYSHSKFPIGAALDINLLLNNSTYRAIAQKQFNSVTPDKAFKADAIHPQQNFFSWQFADTLANFCVANNKRLHGHTLLWHDQMPQWMRDFQGSYSDWDNMLKNHVQTVVTHFKGKVTGWDVVNEAFNEDGTLRNSVWFQNLGASYIEKAFRYAHEADPDVLLFYNDYGLEYNPTKRKAAIKLLNNLRARGVRVDGIGLQAHIFTQFPEASQIADAMQEVAKHGYKVHISEIDISINPLGVTITDKEKQFQRQAYVIAEVVSHYKQLPPHLQYGITFWGIGDGDSWIRSYFSRDDYPLLYDDNYQPKPMYCKLKEAL